jgi:hypothetical protein
MGGHDLGLRDVVPRARNLLLCKRETTNTELPPFTLSVAALDSETLLTDGFRPLLFPESKVLLKHRAKLVWSRQSSGIAQALKV